MQVTADISPEYVFLTQSVIDADHAAASRTSRRSNASVEQITSSRGVLSADIAMWFLHHSQCLVSVRMGDAVLLKEKGVDLFAPIFS